MADNYYDATGVLVLDRVTPVITALFGGFCLDADYPGDGKAYIAQTTASRDSQWSDILDNLSELASQLGLALSEQAEPSIEDVLDAFARHFHADQNEELMELIEQHSFEDTVDLEALFLIASCFNDGHNLVAIEFEGCWYCSKPRLFEFGGGGCFISREVYLSSQSSRALDLGQNLRAALLKDDLVEASALIARETGNLVSGVTDPDVREKLRRGVAEHLLSNECKNAM